VTTVPKTAWRVGGHVNTWLYRVSNGRMMGKAGGVSVLLLTVAGRKTGTPHTNPVSYIRNGESYVVTGSAGGQPAEPQWFRNLRAADRAEIEVGADRIPVSVTIASPEQRATLWARLIEQGPHFAKYQTKTDREIPMAVMTPLPAGDAS
jgi:F420H(2)-dependent quinone reductase